MARFDDMKGVFGLLPTPYREDLEIHIDDLKKVANFCCESGQHGIVWPVMVGEFWFLGEEERIRGLDAVLEEVNGRLPVVFGCSGISVPQVLLYAQAAQKAGADSIIAMTPARTDAATAMDMYRRLAGVFDGPIMRTECRHVRTVARRAGGATSRRDPAGRIRQGGAAARS